MSRLTAPVVLLVVVAGAAAAWLSLPAAQPASPAARRFTVRTLDGQILKSADLRGRPIVLDFWATWSEPCKASMPLLSSMQERFRKKGLVVVGLSVDDAPPQVVRAFAHKLRIRFPVAMATETVLDDYGPIRSIPTTVFIDRRGRIVRRVVGHVDEETFVEFLREIL